MVVAESTTEAEGLAIKDTKTHQRRSVTLPPTLLADLVAHLEGLSTDPDALLWPSRTGKPIRYGSYRRWVWDPAAIKAGLATPKSQPPTPIRRVLTVGRPGPKPSRAPRDLWTVDVTPHSLRATHLSVVAADFSPLEAGRRAGHKNTTVTVAHYARPLADGDLAVVAWLERVHSP